MLIGGRSPNLVLGALTAIFNVIVAFHLGGFAPTIDQVAVVNVAFAALVAMVANTGSIQIAAGKEAQKREDHTNGTTKP